MTELEDMRPLVTRITGFFFFLGGGGARVLSKLSVTFSLPFHSIDLNIKYPAIMHVCHKFLR